MATQVKTGLIANDAITDAKIANVALTGVTASSGDSSTSLATTAFVTGELNSLIDSAPGALNTLNELAAAMGDDANFSTTVTNSIATKLPLAGGTLTGDIAMGTNQIIFDNNSQAILIKDAAGTASYVLYQDNADTLILGNNTNVEKIRLDTNGNEGAVVVDSSGRVGIGGTPSNAQLDIKSSISNKYLYCDDGTNALLEVKGTTSQLELSSQSTGYGAWEDMHIKSHNLLFYQSNDEKMRIASSGSVGIATATNHAGSALAYGLTINSADFSGSGLEIHRTGNSRFELYQNSTGGQYLDALGSTPFMLLATGGTERLKITNTGIVDIGKSAFSSYPTGSQLNVYADGEGIRLDGTGNTTRRIRFRNVGAGTGPGEIVADGSLVIKNEDANAYLNLTSIRNIEYQVTSGNATAGHHIFTSYNTEIMRLDGANNRVGILMGGVTPEASLHIEGNTNGYNTSPLIYFGSTSTNNSRIRDWAIGPADSDYGNFHIFQGVSTGASAVGTPQIAFTIDDNKNVGIGASMTSVAKPLHLKRTSGWATVRLEGASDSGGEIEFYAGSSLKAKMWADNTNGDIYVRAGGNNTTVKFDADGNWIGPHEDNNKRNLIGRGPFNIVDFSDAWHEYYNPAANTEHHISGSIVNNMGITMAFPSNVTKKILQHDRTPFGNVGVIYEAVSDTNSTYNGGFHTDSFTVDPDKGYIFGYYVRRISSASAGTHYGGFSHGISAGTGSNVDSNPYFQAFGNGSLPQGVWCLCYYQLHPRYYQGTGDGGIAGVYRCDNGTRILGHTAWKSPVNQTTQHIRSYNYYCANSSVSIQWYAPFVYEVTGHEPSVASLLPK